MNVSHLEAKLLYHVAQAPGQRLSRHEIMHTLHRYDSGEREAAWNGLVRTGHLIVAQPVTPTGRPPQIAVLTDTGRELVRRLIDDGWMPAIAGDETHEQRTREGS